MLERDCPCGTSDVETIEHIMVFCQFYQEIHVKIIFPLLRRNMGYSDSFTRKFLMGDSLQTTASLQDLFAAACKNRKDILCIALHFNYIYINL